MDGYPTLIYGDGDGTVNLRSLEGCQHWQNLQKQKVFYEPLKNVDHLAILRLVKADEPNYAAYVKEWPKHSWLQKIFHYKDAPSESNKNPLWSRDILYVNDV